MPIYTARAENNNGFLRGIDRSKYKLIRLDKHTPCDVQADFRAVPLPDEGQDTVVFDPPYVTRMSFKPRTKDNPAGSNQKDAFGVNSTGPRSEREIDELYAAGTTEARRILKPGGILILKTMDTQEWRHIELADLPGFKLIDLFIVVTKGKPPGKSYAQKACAEEPLLLHGVPEAAQAYRAAAEEGLTAHREVVAILGRANQWTQSSHLPSAHIQRSLARVHLIAVGRSFFHHCRQVVFPSLLRNP